MRVLRILQFSGNDVIEFFLDTGTITTTALSGVATYNFDPRKPIYNAADDMVYVEGTKDGNPIVIKYNPRTDTIDDEADLSAYGALLDVQGEHLWFSSYPDVYALATADFSVDYTGIGLFSSYSSGGAFAAPGGRLIVSDGVDPVGLHVLTITGPTSISDDSVTLPTPTGTYPWANDSGYQRPYIATGDKAFIYAVASDMVGAIVDLQALTATSVNNPPGVLFDYVASPRWDSRNNAIVCAAQDNADSLSCGLIIDVETSSVIGMAGKDVDLDYTGFYDEPRPLGDGRALIWNGYNHGGIFDEAAPTVEPLSTTPGADWLFLETNGFVIVPPPPDTFFWRHLVRTREDLEA